MVPLTDGQSSLQNRSDSILFISGEEQVMEPFSQQLHVNKRSVRMIRVESFQFTHERSLTRYFCDRHRHLRAGKAAHHADRGTGRQSHILQCHSGTFPGDKNSLLHTTCRRHSRPQLQRELDKCGHTNSRRFHTLGLQGTPKLANKTKISVILNDPLKK